MKGQEFLVYIDEAHIHLDADLRYSWGFRGKPLWVSSTSFRTWERSSFYGVYLYNEGQVKIFEFERANKENTVKVISWLRESYPTQNLVVVWDGARYHSASLVKEEAQRLGIRIEFLSSYSPDFMPVEALWRWLREDVKYNYSQFAKEELLAHVAGFEQRINQNPCLLADRLWVKDHLDPDEEKLRFSN